MRDDLLEIVLRGLDVQAGQLDAEHHGRAGPRGDEVADRRETGIAAWQPMCPTISRCSPGGMPRSLASRMSRPGWRSRCR